MPNSAAKVLDDPRLAFDELGYAGPFALANLHNVQVVAAKYAELGNEIRNRHHEVPEIMRVFSDPAFRQCLEERSDGPFVMWRTNFFAKGAGTKGQGAIGWQKGAIGWHHDKHFQNRDSDIDFSEIGAHLSVLVALQDMTLHNGAFEVLPGSHLPVEGFSRDPRPYYLNTASDHFVNLPTTLQAGRVQITLRQGEFVLFHSALMHRSLAYRDGASRVSLTARLARHDIEIPTWAAAANFCVPLS